MPFEKMKIYRISVVLEGESRPEPFDCLPYVPG